MSEVKPVQTKLEKLRSKIEQAAKSTDYLGKSGDGYFDVQSFSGGNFDDAFSLGETQGYGDLARDLLAILDE